MSVLWIFFKKEVSKRTKEKDHCHLTGNYLEVARTKVNIDAKKPTFVPLDLVNNLTTKFFETLRGIGTIMKSLILFETQMRLLLILAKKSLGLNDVYRFYKVVFMICAIH